MAQSDHQLEAHNKATVEAAFEGWRAGTGSPFDLLADQVSWTIVGGSDVAKTYSSKAAFMRQVAEPLGARMSVGLKPTIREIYADGDAVIVYFDADGVARNGTPYANSFAWFLHLQDDKIVKGTAFFDSIAFNTLWRAAAK